MNLHYAVHVTTQSSVDKSIFCSTKEGAGSHQLSTSYGAGEWVLPSKVLKHCKLRGGSVCLYSVWECLGSPNFFLEILCSTYGFFVLEIWDIMKTCNICTCFTDSHAGFVLV